MTVRRPTLEDLRRADRALELGLADGELAEYVDVISGLVPAMERLDALSRPADGERFPRRQVSPPADNPLGAWYWRCSVEGASSGPLRGKRVALKDNIALAAVPMSSGSALLEGYTPEFDATVATRILEAGGEIVGKAVCEDMCLSAGSHTAVTGPVRNPRDPGRSAGGSSSGCAALVAAGECDMAVGGDQGGSIRIPSALCGIVGHKPTYGLVPYTGAVPLDQTVDHLGPMAPTVADAALLLDVLAGEDGLDPRQRGVHVQPCMDSLATGVRGLRIGLLEEGFGLPGSDGRVDATVREAASSFGELGASVRSVAVAWHLDALSVLSAILAVGFVRGVVHGNAVGSGWSGFYPASLGEWFAESRRKDAGRLAPSVKMFALLGQYLDDAGGSGYYSKAQNLRRDLTAAYEVALAGVDLLVMPTTQIVAEPLPPPEPSVAESLAAGFSYALNTAQFDLTGHPAVSVPCGLVDGLPVGMMLVGRHFQDDVVLRAAYAFEQAGGGAARKGARP